MTRQQRGALVERLQALQARDHQAHIESWHEIPARPAHTAPWPAELAEELHHAAGQLGIHQLYTHQAAAAAAALAGHHVAVATGTASGKSLCYLLPILDAVLRTPSTRALLLFPTKALAHDQLAAMQEWDRHLGIELHAAAYDGDTPPSERRRIRQSARLVLSNPDMLHTGILPNHTRWATLFEGLAYVVLDEMHVYRGVFGSHVANVLRRLRRVARFYGTSPQFLMTSATIANPGELGRHLAGAPVQVIGEDGSPRGRRVFIFYNPPVVDQRLNLRRSPILETEALARHFLGGQVQTIVFARTRQSAELIVRHVGQGLQEARGGTELVRGYRGGYLASERRAIEAALRQGSLRGVVATNALELGVDIGQLDVCLMAGYPGTIASTWQQAGRAGRRGELAVAVLVAGSDPLDQFIVRHPDYVLKRSPEQARLDPDNRLILLDHVRCAAFELPFGPQEAARPFGDPPGPQEGEQAAAQTGEAAADAEVPSPVPTAGELLSVLEAEGVVREAGDSWYWLADSYPAARVSLRSAPGQVVILKRRAPPAAESQAQPAWEVLGTVERPAAALMVHPGAVYLHDGVPFRVTELDWEQGQAEVVPTDGSVYTRATSSTQVRPIRTIASRAAPGATLHHGQLEVRSRVTGYRVIRFRTHETVAWRDLDLPELEHRAAGYWFTLDEAALDRLRSIGTWRHDPSADRGPNWPRQRDRARQRDGYRCRLCGAPERPGRRHDVHHLRPFRQFADLAEGNGCREANALDNLITLCRSCHRLAERILGLHGGLSGVGHALAHIAPLFLMCDARDLGVTTESHAPWSGRPTVVIYERAMGGVGFGAALFELHEAVVRAAAELIRDCPCTAGCPSCVGPPAEPGEAKAHALAVLSTLVDRAPG